MCLSRKTESLRLGHEVEKSAKGYLLTRGNWNKKTLGMAESPKKAVERLLFSYLDTSRNNSRGNFKPSMVLKPLILLVFWAKKNPFHF